MNKKDVRKKALLLRKKLDVALVSNEIIKKIIENEIIDNFVKIGLYYPLNYEINLMDVLDIFPNKLFYLPVTGEKLDFVKYNLNDPLKNGLFNTKEPSGKSIDINELDCIFVPCVAISNSKQRIGYGKGYYDQSLASYKGLKIGVCYKELAHEDVLMNDYDLILDIILEG